MDWLGHHLGYFVALAVIPFATFVLNYMARTASTLPQTTGADLVLLVAGFDAAIVLDIGQIAPLIRDPTLRENAVQMFQGFSWACVIVWALYIAVVEQLFKHYVTGMRSRIGRFLCYTVAWFPATLCVSAQVLSFTFTLKAST